MLFRTQIIFCSSELRLHFRIAEVGSLLSLNRAWRAQVTILRNLHHCNVLNRIRFTKKKKKNVFFFSVSLYSVQNIAIHRIRLIFDSSNTLVYRDGPMHKIHLHCAINV